MVRLLSSADVASVISMSDIIPVVENAFSEHARNQVVMPCKIYLDVPGYGDFRAMPAYIPSGKTAGIKWVNVHPGNRAYNKPTVMATILLNNPATGEPTGIMDGTLITDMRTGAAGAVATKHLARRDASIVGLIGCGRQAWTQMLAHYAVYGDEIWQVKVYDLDLDAANAMAERIMREMSCNAVACTRPEHAADADIVITTTPSRKPVLKREWIRPGTHINAIGADAPGKQELETALTASAKVFVDSVDQASHSGEINVPWGEGKLNEQMLAGTIGEVIAGIRPGRTDDREITVFDSTGLSIQDMAVAHLVYERAILEGVGRDFDLFESGTERSSGNAQKVAARVQ
ncbi:MAG: Alanine dehydrogenase [Methanocella sp. PtaU1.Bin125]|nr:MAG: Alanine dehydrogenase [Methanocella sp. PtaU1.Bin125]